MKVIDIVPGVIQPYRTDAGTEYRYTIEFIGSRGKSVYTSREGHPSFASAKQAMREKLYHEKKRHGV